MSKINNNKMGWGAVNEQSVSGIAPKVIIIDFNLNPTLTKFNTPVASGNEDTTIAISFGQMKTSGDEADSDGLVVGFAIKSVDSGILKIGTTLTTASLWNSVDNYIVDAVNKAFWLPPGNANGVINAFKAVAIDDVGDESFVPVQAQVNVLPINDMPTLSTPIPIIYTDTKYDDTFAPSQGFLQGSDPDGTPLTYGIYAEASVGNTVSILSVTGTMLTVNKISGAFTVTVDDHNVESGFVGKDSFIVTVSDGVNTIQKNLVVDYKQQGITETEGNDTLNGDANNNKFDALSGNDFIDGKAGADTMRGGLGNDTFVVDNIGDKVIETSALVTEIDHILSAVSFTLSANVEKLTLTGTGAINGSGNSLKNIMTGNDAANILNGGANADTLIGGLGNDTYMVDSAGDVVSETSTLATEIDKVQSAVSHTLKANVENLILLGTAAINGVGNSLKNSITGNSVINNLNGGLGNDTLVGKNGNDNLTGGLGNDTFVLDTLPNASTNRDTIADFNGAVDTIKLDNAVFTKFLTPGTVTAANFVVGANALDNNDFLVYNNANGILYYDNDGNGSNTKVEIVALTGIPSLNAADLVIF